MEKNDVLMIDDDVNNRILLEKLIKSKGGSIVAVEDYEKAKDILDNYIPKVLIVDYYLPGKTGTEVITELNTKYNLRDCQIIVSTARSISDSEKAEYEKEYNCIILDKLTDKNQLLQLVVEKIRKK